ncbi:MAG: hypothetical protein L0G46_09955, partial [Kocuria sp.]|nr:hypothetical protein [Kocuria sp.]
MPGSKRPDKAQGRGTVSRLRSLLGRKGGTPSFPGAKPRPRFGLPDVEVPQDETRGRRASNDMPPGGPSETENCGSEELDDASRTGTDQAEPGQATVASTPMDATMPVRNPVQFGFLVTVGVGLALLVYYLAANVGALGGWITGAMFIALGLDPIVRWFESRGLPRIGGVAIVLLGFAG